jgi:2,3-bisphosphoglycerate-independent phosphoglycerate mutase
VKGTVTIPLEDYHTFIEESTTNSAVKKSLRDAARELEVFLSFIINVEGMDRHVESFNAQSKHSTIEVINGRAKIQFKNEEKTELPIT